MRNHRIFQILKSKTNFFFFFFSPGLVSSTWEKISNQNAPVPTPPPPGAQARSPANSAAAGARDEHRSPRAPEPPSSRTRPRGALSPKAAPRSPQGAALSHRTRTGRRAPPLGHGLPPPPWALPAHAPRSRPRASGCGVSRPRPPPKPLGPRTLSWVEAVAAPPRGTGGRLARATELLASKSVQCSQVEFCMQVFKQYERESRALLFDSVGHGLYSRWHSPGLNTGAFPFSSGSSQARDWTQVSCNAGGSFTVWVTRGSPVRQNYWWHFEWEMLLLSFSGRKTNHSDKPHSSLKCRHLLESRCSQVSGMEWATQRRWFERTGLLDLLESNG